MYSKSQNQKPLGAFRIQHYLNSKEKFSLFFCLHIALQPYRMATGKVGVHPIFPCNVFVFFKKEGATNKLYLVR